MFLKCQCHVICNYSMHNTLINIIKIVFEIVQSFLNNYKAKRLFFIKRCKLKVISAVGY